MEWKNSFLIFAQCFKILIKMQLPFFDLIFCYISGYWIRESIKHFLREDHHLEEPFMESKNKNIHFMQPIKL